MYKCTGVNLRPSKKPLVLSRLRRRLEDLEMNTFMEYVPMLENHQSGELEVFINALTTNETYFFRHTKQFNYLFEKVLPELLQNKNKSGDKEVRIWTAACSTGEEPYSIAITCKEFFKTHTGYRLQLNATDINTEVMDFAKKGAYFVRSLKEMSESLRKRYFLVSKDVKQEKEIYTLNAEVKKMVQFGQHNLLKEYKSSTSFDIIFLRNVMIYFDPETKQKVVNNLLKNLSIGGYIFISLSESLSDVGANCLELVYSGVYKKVERR